MSAPAAADPWRIPVGDVSSDPVGPDVGHGAAPGDGQSGDDASSVVRGWVLRAALVPAAAMLVALSLASGSGAAVLTAAGLVLVVLGVVTIIAPQTPAPFGLQIGALLAHLLLDDAQFDLGLGLLAVSLVVVQQMSGLCAQVPVRARIPLVVLRPVIIRLAAGVAVAIIAVAAASALIG